MNWAICSAYLAYKNNLPKVIGAIIHCSGCRKRNKQCVFLKKWCEDNLKLLRGEMDFCFECNCFPCDGLRRTDERCQRDYGMSMIENLKEIKKKGIHEFIKKQYQKYKCPKCNNLDFGSQ